MRTRKRARGFKLTNESQEANSVLQPGYQEPTYMTLKNKRSMRMNASVDKTE